MKQYKLIDLACAHCADKMVRKIKKIKGVESAEINFLTSKLFISYDESKETEILVEAQKIISKIEPQCTLEI